MKEFQSLWPHFIACGPGRARDLKAYVEGKSVLFMGDPGVRKLGLAAPVLASLGREAAKVDEYWEIPPEPSEYEVSEVVANLESAGVAKPDLVLAMGGGSVMDMAKFVSVMLGGGPSMDELFAGKLPEKRSVGLMMIPTTAGTGSEATPNSIVLRPEQNLKVGVVCPAFMPDQVILDPELLSGLPPKITAATGMDALCHALECFVAKKANPISDMFSLESMRLIFKSLKKAFDNGADLDARMDTLLAAFYGGMAIASSGTNAVHALSYPLGGRYRIPHGISNAVLLAPVFAYHRNWITDKLAQAAEIAAKESGECLAGKSAQEKADYLIASLDKLVRELKIPTTLEELGIPAKDLDLLVDSAFEVKRLLSNNPRELSKDDIRTIYTGLFSELA